jgi:C_GCAxxG_C_C family probable redox protein
MKSKDELAVESFRSGLNCSQSVVMAYAEEMNFDRNLALSISCGFGGGMGRLQETCGAATGAFMVMGIHYCRMYSDNKERKETTYAAIQKFSKEFTVLHGTMNCMELINVDLKTEDGHRILKESNLSENVCEKCILDSIKITENILNS